MDRRGACSVLLERRASSSVSSHRTSRHKRQAAFGFVGSNYSTENTQLRRDLDFGQGFDNALF